MEMIVKPEIVLEIDREVDDSESTLETMEAMRHWLEKRFEAWLTMLVPGDYEICLTEHKVGCVRPKFKDVNEVVVELGPEDQAALEDVVEWEKQEDYRREMENLQAL